MKVKTDGRLAGKVAIITGSGQGIGRAAALLFAEEGAALVVADINRDSGEKTAAEIRDSGGCGQFCYADVSSSRDVQALMKAVEEEQGRLDVLYNNASVFIPGQDGRITDIKEEAWDKVLATNLKSVYLCCKYGIPLMLQGGGGSIINTASSAGVIGIPECDAYTATKGATISLTRSLAVEYRPQNIRVNCISPGAVWTETSADTLGPAKDRIVRGTPLKRMGTPEDIALAAIYLSSPASSWVTGKILEIDGGIYGQIFKPG